MKLKTFHIFLLLLIVSVLISGCDSYSQRLSEQDIATRLECLTANVEKDSSRQEAEFFLKSFKDTLNSWIQNTDIELMDSYRNRQFEISDQVVFNENRTMGIGFILNLSPDYQDSKIILGEAINGMWHFYYLTYPDISFGNLSQHFDRREEIKSYMNQESLKTLVITGFYASNQCLIDQEYFSKRVNNRVREFHKHVFLSGTYPKDIRTLGKN